MPFYHFQSPFPRALLQAIKTPLTLPVIPFSFSYSPVLTDLDHHFMPASVCLFSSMSNVPSSGKKELLSISTWDELSCQTSVGLQQGSPPAPPQKGLWLVSPTSVCISYFNKLIVLFVPQLNCMSVEAKHLLFKVGSFWQMDVWHLNDSPAQRMNRSHQLLIAWKLLSSIPRDLTISPAVSCFLWDRQPFCTYLSNKT